MSSCFSVPYWSHWNGDDQGVPWLQYRYLRLLNTNSCDPDSPWLSTVSDAHYSDTGDSLPTHFIRTHQINRLQWFTVGKFSVRQNRLASYRWYERDTTYETPYSIQLNVLNTPTTTIDHYSRTFQNRIYTLFKKVQRFSRNFYHMFIKHFKIYICFNYSFIFTLFLFNKCTAP